LFNQLAQLPTEMNQLFEQWVNNNWPLGRSAGYPAVNVWEEGDQVRVEAELPGMDLKNLEIFVTGGNELTLKGERKPPVPEKVVWHRQERNYGSFSRMITLPFLVDADKVEAKLENGILRITLAKHESARPRKIAVKAQ
jgi:HSP20 family protein